jgi:hypothetical protein
MYAHELAKELKVAVEQPKADDFESVNNDSLLK